MNLRCQSFVSGITTKPRSECFPGSPQLPVPSPGLHGWLGDPARGSPSLGVGFPGLLGLPSSRQVPRLLRAPGVGVVTRSRPALRLGVSLHSEKIHRGSGPLSTFRAATSLRREPGPAAAAPTPTTQAPHHSQLASLACPPSPRLRLLGRRGRAESGTRPSPGPPLPEPWRHCDWLRDPPVWVGAPRPVDSAWSRPRAAPPPSEQGLLSPGPPHSLSRSMNCQSTPGGC